MPAFGSDKLAPSKPLWESRCQQEKNENRCWLNWKSKCPEVTAKMVLIYFQVVDASRRNHRFLFEIKSCHNVCSHHLSRWHIETEHACNCMTHFLPLTFVWQPPCGHVPHSLSVWLFRSCWRELNTVVIYKSVQLGHCDSGFLLRQVVQSADWWGTERRRVISYCPYKLNDRLYCVKQKDGRIQYLQRKH